MASSASRRPDAGARVLLIAASAVVVVAGLQKAGTIILPLLVAVLLSILSAPIMAWLLQRGAPRAIAVLTTVFANLAVLAGVLLLVGGSVNAFVRTLPEYQSRLEVQTRELNEWLRENNFDTAEFGWLFTLGNGESSTTDEPSIAVVDAARADADADPSRAAPADVDAAPVAARDAAQAAVGDGESSADAPARAGAVSLDALINIVAGTLRGVASLVSSALLVLLTMTFLLLEGAGLPRKLRRAFNWRDDQLARVMKAKEEIQRYLIIKTLISLLTGLLIALWLSLLGVRFPLLWALVAFLFNYIPTLGSIIAAVPVALLTLIDSGVGPALVVILGYLAVNIVIGNLVEPQLMGRQFGLSALIVFVSLVFWGWLWGPVGMLLSVPLTVILKILLENTEDLRWLAVLLGAPRRARVTAVASTASAAVPPSVAPPS
ncbi:MAG: AI-2E family transporter [Acidobacteriota bacterium]